MKVEGSGREALPFCCDPDSIFTKYMSITTLKIQISKKKFKELIDFNIDQIQLFLF